MKPKIREKYSRLRGLFARPGGRPPVVPIGRSIVACRTAVRDLLLDPGQRGDKTGSSVAFEQGGFGDTEIKCVRICCLSAQSPL